MSHRTGVREIIPVRVGRAALAAPPDSLSARSGEESQLSPLPWQRFSQGKRNFTGHVCDSRSTNTHDSCCFHATRFDVSGGRDLPRRVSTRAHWCRLMSGSASKGPGLLSLRRQQTITVGAPHVGRCYALRDSLAAGTLYLSSTSTKVMCERLFTHQRSGEGSCLQPKTPWSTCVRRNSPGHFASRPGPSVGGGKKETDPHSSSAAAWCDTPRPPWIPGPERTAAQRHKTRRLKKHARRPFREGKDRRACRKAKRVTSPRFAPTTVDPNTVEEVPVSPTLARPAPRFTSRPGMRSITFPQISGHLVIR